MELTQEQIDILGYNLRRKKIKIDILDINYKILYDIEGNAISGTINVNAENDIRRSGNITIALPVNEKSVNLLEELNGYSIEYNGKIWIDKNVQIYIGILDNKNNTVWYNMGIFLINQPKTTIKDNQYELYFEIVDLVANLNGVRKGQLTGGGLTIKTGEYITQYNSLTQQDEKVFKKNTVQDVFLNLLLNVADIKKFKIYPIPEINKYIPYDMKFGIGITIYEVLKEILSTLENWQMYYDRNGVFVIEPIFSGLNGVIYPLNNNLLLGQELSYDFENMKNQIIIYGKVNNLSFYTTNTDSVTDNVQYLSNKLILKYDNVIDLSRISIKGTKFGFMSLEETNTNPITEIEIWSNGQKIIYSNNSITMSLTKFENSTKSFGVEYSTSQVEIGAIPPSTICYISIWNAELNNDESIDFNKSVNFQFMGKQTVSYTLVNDNKESPFYVNNNYKYINYYCGKAQTDTGFNLGENYLLTLNDNDNPVSQLEDSTILTFMANANNIYSSGNSSFTSISVRSSDGTQILTNIPLVQNYWQNNNRVPVQENKLANDFMIWELQYLNNQFVLNGQNKNVYPLILTGGEYDNIKCDELAYQRCVKELYDHSNLKDNVNLFLVPDYLVDANYKIPYHENSAHPINIYDTQQFITSENEKFVTIDNKDFYVKYDKITYFLVKQVSYPLGVDSNAQTIVAIKIYNQDNLTQNE